MKKKHLVALLITGIVICTSGCGVSTDGLLTEQSVSQDVISIDEQKQSIKDMVINPQDDFYGYVNKDELMNMSIEYGNTSEGSFEIAEKKVDETLKQRFEEILSSNEDYEEGSSEYIIKKAYSQYDEFVNNEEQKAAAKQSVYGELERIKALNSVDELLAELQHVKENYGVSCIFGLGVDQNYLKTDEYAIIAQQYPSFCGADILAVKEAQSRCVVVEDNVIQAYMVSGLDSKSGKAVGKDLAYMILDIAWDTDKDILQSISPYSTFKSMSLAELDEKLTNLDTATIQKISGITSNPYGEWIYQDIDQLIALDRQFTEENLEALKAWMIIDFLSSYENYIAEDFDFLKSLDDMSDEAREDYRMNTVMQAFTEATGDIYTRAAFTQEMSDELDRMCEDIREGYKIKISSADWISDAGRKKLLEKLDNIEFVTGKNSATAEDIKRSCVFGNTWFETDVKVRQQTIKDQLSHIGKAKDKLKAGMTMNVTNACYSPENTVTITVAIMGGEFFDISEDYYSNLGGLGAIVAHEIGHGFDSNCIEWDMNGNYNPAWLPAEDVEALEARNRIASAYFEDNFSVFDVYHVDGDKTLGENYADLSAVEVLMTRCSNKQQREKVYESYASIWRELTIENNVINQIDIDPHSPATIRVNAILATVQEFTEDYDLKEGDGMYVAPEKRISRW